MLKHLAIIMDGNGRWGKLHLGSRTKGHKEGIKALDNTIKNCIELNIDTLTVYAFSTENWKRPAYEVNMLMKMFYDYLCKKREVLNKENIRLIISGNREKLTKKLIDKIEETENYLKNNDKFTLNICFNYGGQDEIIRATNELIQQGKSKITKEDIDSILYSKLSAPDLIIRTGGDTRLSNFLLWQCAYAEMSFINVLWPDFSKKDLIQAINEFENRNRKYGGLNVK